MNTNATSESLSTNSTCPLATFWQGKRVLITGGSQGLGRALALEAAAAGAQVAIVARHADGLNAVVEKARAQVQAGIGLPIHPIQADVADKLAIYRIAGEAVGLLGGVDILINCAGYLGVTPLRLLLDTDCEDIEIALQANLLGPFRLAKAVIPGMLLRQEGLIVNLSSDAAVNAYPTWGGYSTSKAALDQLSRILDVEVRAQGVRVVALDPGDMDTAMLRAAIPDADPATLNRPEDVAKGLMRFLPRAIGLDTVRFSGSEWRHLLEAEQGAGTQGASEHAEGALS